MSFSKTAQTTRIQWTYKTATILAAMSAILPSSNYKSWSTMASKLNNILQFFSSGAINLVCSRQGIPLTLEHKTKPCYKPHNPHSRYDNRLMGLFSLQTDRGGHPTKNGPFIENLKRRLGILILPSRCFRGAKKWLLLHLTLDSTKPSVSCAES